MKLITAVLVVIIFAVPVSAEDSPNDLNAEKRPNGSISIMPEEEARRIHEQCGEQEGFPGAIAGCLLENERKRGQNLARVYKLLMNRENESRRKALRESQRAWLKYQKTECRYQAAIQPTYGAWAPLSEARCLLLTTLQREVALLRAYREEREYDW